MAYVQVKEKMENKFKKKLNYLMKSQQYLNVFNIFFLIQMWTAGTNEWYNKNYLFYKTIHPKSHTDKSGDGWMNKKYKK